MSLLSAMKDDASQKADPNGTGLSLSDVNSAVIPAPVAQEAPAGPRRQPIYPGTTFETRLDSGEHVVAPPPSDKAYEANLGPNIPGQFVYDPTKPSNSLRDAPRTVRAVDYAQKQGYTHGVPGAFTQIDHIMPIWLGGTQDPENLRDLPDIVHSHITKLQAIPLALSIADQAHRDWVANPVGKEPPDVAKLIGHEWSLSEARNMAIDSIHQPLAASNGIVLDEHEQFAAKDDAQRLKIAVAAYKKLNAAPSSAPKLQDTIGSLKGFFSPAVAAKRAAENKPVVSAWQGLKSLVPTSVSEVKSIFNKENLSTAGHDLGHSPLAAAAREAADQATLGRIPVKPTENETGFAYDAAKLAGGTLGSFFPVILGGAALGKVFGAAESAITKYAPSLAKTLYGGRIATQAAVEAGDINAIRGAALKSEGFLQKYGPRFAKNSVLFGGLSQIQHYDEDTVANRAKAMASSLGISAVVSAVNPGLSKGLMGVFLGTGVISMLEGGSWKDALTSASTMTLFHGLGGDHAVPLGDKALWKAAVDKSAQHRSTVMGSDAYVPERAITDRSFKKKAGAINYRLDSETRTIDQKLWADSKGREEDIHASNMGDVQKEEALKEERSKLQADRAKNITAARALYLSSMPDKMRAIETAKDLKSLREHVDKAEAAKAEAAKKNTEGYSEKSTPPGADVPKREAEVSGPAQATEGPSVVFGEPEKAVDNFPDTPDQGPPMPKDWLSIAGNVQTDAQKAETAAYAKHTGDAFMDAVARTKATADQKSESAKDVSEALANRPEAPIVARPQPGSVVKGPENLNPQPDSRFRKPPGSGWTLVRNAVEGKTEKRTKITGRKAAKIAAEASKDPLKFQKNVNEALNAGTIDKTTVRLLSDDQIIGAIRKVAKMYNSGHGKAPEARQRAMRAQAEMLFDDVVARDSEDSGSALHDKAMSALTESNASHPPARPVHPEIEVGAREVVSQDPTIPYAEAVAIATKDRLALVAAGIAEPPAPVLADRGLPTKDNPTKINAQSEAISNARAQFGSAEHVTDVKERLAKLRLGKEEPVTAERRSEDFATEAQHESYVSANKDIEHSLKQVEANHNNDSVNENTDPIRNTTLRANLEKDLDANITELKAELHRRESRDGIVGKKSPQEAYGDSVLTDEHVTQLEAEGRARIESMVADEKGTSFQGTPKEKGIQGEAARQAAASHEPQTKSDTEDQKALVASENMATYEHHASERTFDVSSMGSPSEQARMLKLLTSMHERGDITKRQADDVAEAYRTGDWSAVAEGPLRYDPVFSPVAADAQRWYDVATASKDNPSRDQGSYEATYDFAPTKKAIVKGLLGKATVKDVPAHPTISQDDKTRAAYMKAYIDGSKVFSFKGQQEEAIPDSILNRPEIVSRRAEIHQAMQLTSNEHVLNENPFDEFNRPLGESGHRLGLSKEQYKDFEDGRYTDGKKAPNPFAFVLADAAQKSQAKGDPKSALMWDGTLRAANEEAAARFARGESPYETLADIPVKDAHKALFPEGTGNEGVSRENLYDPRVANAMSLAPAIGNPAFRTNDPFINRIIDAYREKLISTKGGVRIKVTAQPSSETDNTFNLTNHAFGFANEGSLIGKHLMAIAETPEARSQVARYLRSDFDIQFLQDPKLEDFAHAYDDARADNDTPAQASRKAITAAKLEDEATQKLGEIYAEDASEHPLSEEHFDAKKIPKTPSDIVRDGIAHPDVETMLNEMIARGDSGKAQAADYIRQSSKVLGRYFLDASLKDVETQRKALSAAEKDAARATEVIARVEKKLESERELPKRKVLKYEIAHAKLRLKIADIARAEAAGEDASKIRKDVRQAKMDLKKAPAPTAWKDVRDKVRQLQTGDVKQTAAEAGIRGLDEKIAQAKKDIASAKELGDLSENPEYHEAKDRLAELENDKYLQEQGIVAPSPEDIAKKKATRDAAEAADPRQKMRRLSESARAATQAYNKVMAGERPAKP